MSQQVPGVKPGNLLLIENQEFPEALHSAGSLTDCSCHYKKKNP
jgi:hypothetical protein